MNTDRPFSLDAIEDEESGAGHDSRAGRQSSDVENTHRSETPDDDRRPESGDDELAASAPRARRGSGMMRQAEIAVRRIFRTAEAGADLDALSDLADAYPFPMLRADGTGEVLYANPAAMDLGEALGTIKDGHLVGAWKTDTERTLHRRLDLEREEVGPTGVVCLSFQPDPVEEVVNIYGLETTRFKEAVNALRLASQRDSLTGLPNRPLFLDRLEQNLASARRSGKLVAVHLINLDRFKDINEALGHEKGDRVIRVIARRLRDLLRESDTVARVGPDEFAVIQPDPGEASNAGLLAQRMLDAVSTPVAVHGIRIDVTATAGITVFPDDGEAAEQLIRNADMALDYGKSERRGSYRFFVSDMDEEVRRRRTIEDNLRSGLESGQFVLHYQPKLNLTHHHITGFEALIRWNRPDQGFVSPAEFIPIAERSRLILPIGAWVINEACRQARTWVDQGVSPNGEPMKVAVNLSAVQFKETTIATVVREALTDNGLAPEHLELEITETAAMDDADTTVEIFEELASLGVSLSIDDFGTGYSSLAYLRSFPVQRIKIDKAFIDDIGSPENPGAIARAVTNLGHSLGMQVTAEGVETEDQLRFLSDLDCDEIQGFFVSEPLAAQAVPEFIDSYKGLVQ